MPCCAVASRARGVSKAGLLLLRLYLPAVLHGTVLQLRCTFSYVLPISLVLFGLCFFACFLQSHSFPGMGWFAECCCGGCSLPCALL